MGVDLIGFIAKGPLDLLNKKQVAVKFLEERNVFLKESVTKLLDFAEDESADYAELFNGDELLLDFLDNCNGSFEDDAQSIEDELIIKDPKKFVEEFIDFWFDGARDSMGRIDPDDPTKVIVFAGDATWGDEPNGYGYTLLKKIIQTGLDDVFGIR